MIKKTFKFIFKSFLLIILLAAISYGTFHLWEYATGGKYIAYIENNKETVGLNEHFTFEIAESDLKNSKLILVGEIHGFKTPTVFDVDLFSHLNKNHGVRHYIAEVDFLQARLLNQFLKDGDNAKLEKALAKWAVFQGRNNLDYYAKYYRLQRLYTEAAGENKFEFIGVDQLQDFTLLAEFINDLDSSQTFSENFTNEEWSSTIEKMINSQLYSGDTLQALKHIKSNLHHLSDKIGREETMFRNFRDLYEEKSLRSQKVYGYFGLYHVFQYNVNGKSPLAAKIRTSNLNLDGKITSFNFLMNDSYMVMPSNQLPEFMQTGPINSKMEISADNLLFMYLYGIKDFKRTTEPNTQSIIKLNNLDSPYGNSSRMIKAYQLLPVTDLMEMTEPGKEYAQYTVFVRNSDWAEPMRK